ncbi:unnamed protein product [marine sediment metagenome]|uniref:HTH merR-type domain-containing protein n=1 Tax=marine sediment metagenome TaxID=412755 RepID=X0XE13_9ZZZZ
MLLAEAAKAANLPYRTAARWIETGLIRVPGYKAISRVPIPVTQKTLTELTVLAKLRSVLSIQALRKAAKRLRRMGENPYSSGKFAALQGPPGKRQLVKFCETGEAIELLGKGSGQWLLLPMFDDNKE